MHISKVSSPTPSQLAHQTLPLTGDRVTSPPTVPSGPAHSASSAIASSTVLPRQGLTQSALPPCSVAGERRSQFCIALGIPWGCMVWVQRWPLAAAQAGTLLRPQVAGMATHKRLEFLSTLESPVPALCIMLKLFCFSFSPICLLYTHTL